MTIFQCFKQFFNSGGGESNPDELTRFTSVQNPYIRKKIKETSWSNRKYINDLIGLDRWIRIGRRGLGVHGNMAFDLKIKKYPDEYLELLKAYPEKYNRHIEFVYGDKISKPNQIETLYQDWQQAGGLINDSETIEHQYVYGRPGTSQFALFVHQIPDKEFVLTRSTLPLLAYWKYPNHALKQLGLLITKSAICLEYPVPTLEPADTPSLSDLVILNSEQSVIIEAKWHELPYKSVKERLEIGNYEKSLNVINHWLSLIQPFAKNTLAATYVVSIDYQVLHRCASACSMAMKRKNNAKLVYQVFTDEETNHHSHYKNELEKLIRIIQPKSCLKIFLQTIQIDSFSETYQGLLESGHRRHAFKIRQALIQNDLFQFKNEILLELTKGRSNEN